MQQYLPLAVLKRFSIRLLKVVQPFVATVLTACGIETGNDFCSFIKVSVFVATVLTACGIETTKMVSFLLQLFLVATVLTACGIETSEVGLNSFSIFWRLQQYLPLAVLKPVAVSCFGCSCFLLQQYLPLAVLKLYWR